MKERPFLCKRGSGARELPGKRTQPLLPDTKGSGSILLVIDLRVAAVDIETFASIEDLGFPEYRYLRTRGEKDRSDEELEQELALNPYVLQVISAAVACVEEEKITEVSVYYISSSGEEVRETHPFPICYTPVLCPSPEENLPEAEELLLEELWQDLESAELLVTYNGQSFDLPVLRLRSMIHGLDLPPSIAAPHSPRLFDGHLDLAQFLSCSVSGHRYTLEFVCRRFGIPLNKGRMDGSKVHDAFLEGRYFDIARYNAQDAIATARLYLRLKKYLSPESLPLPDPPTDNQLRHFTNLVANQSTGNAEFYDLLFAWFVERGILTKRNISQLIDDLKNGRLLL